MSRQIKERSIVFEADDVLAYLGGEKTQLRIPFDSEPFEREYEGVTSWYMATPGKGSTYDCNYRWMQCRKKDSGELIEEKFYHIPLEEWLPSLCPLGRVGDKFWVKESFARRRDVDPKTEEAKALQYLHYRATYGDPDLSMEWHDYYPGWRPSTQMGRWASRIVPTITDVRVERLHDVTEADALAEGVCCLTEHVNLPAPPDYARGLFKAKWEKTHRWTGRWEKNPRVWVVEFTNPNRKGFSADAS